MNHPRFTGQIPSNNPDKGIITHESVIRHTRSGYPLSYIGLVLFTLVLYLRPNDILPIGEFPIAKIIGAGALIAFLLEGLSSGQLLKSTPKEVKYLGALLALAFLSVPLAIDPGEATNAIFDQFLKVVLVFFLLISSVTSYARLRRLMSLTVFCGAVIAFGTLRNFLAGNNLVGGYRATGMIGGIFGDPNDLALALVMLLSLSVGLAITSLAVQGRLLYFACAGIMLVAVCSTYSRGGFLALFATGAFLMRKIGRRHTGLMLILGLAVLAVLLFGPTGLGGRVYSIFDQSLDSVGSAQARTMLLGRALHVVAFNPKVWAVGLGVGNFHIVSVKEGATHNSYLEVLAEIGIPALVLYLLFLTGAYKGLGRIARSSSADPTSQPMPVMAMAIRGSLLAYMVGSFFLSVAYDWHLYYTAGYAVCLRQIVETDRA